MIEFGKYLAIMFKTRKIVQIFFKFFLRIYSLILCDNLLFFCNFSEHFFANYFSWNLFAQIFVRKIFYNYFRDFFRNFIF